jgi:hypothetical protein
MRNENIPIGVALTDIKAGEIVNTSQFYTHGPAKMPTYDFSAYASDKAACVTQAIFVGRTPHDPFVADDNPGLITPSPGSFFAPDDEPPRPETTWSPHKLFLQLLLTEVV